MKRFFSIITAMLLLLMAGCSSQLKLDEAEAKKLSLECSNLVKDFKSRQLVTTNSKETGYIEGKVILVQTGESPSEFDKVKFKEDGSAFEVEKFVQQIIKVPSALRPEKPEEIGTIVIENSGQEPETYYRCKNMRTGQVSTPDREFVEYFIVNRKSRTVVGQKRFVGDVDAECKSTPIGPQLGEFLMSLPRR